MTLMLSEEQIQQKITAGLHGFAQSVIARGSYVSLVGIQYFDPFLPELVSNIQQGGIFLCSGDVRQHGSSRFSLLAEGFN